MKKVMTLFESMSCGRIKEYKYLSEKDVFVRYVIYKV